MNQRFHSLELWTNAPMIPVKLPIFSISMIISQAYYVIHSGLGLAGGLALFPGYPLKKNSYSVASISDERLTAIDNDNKSLSFSKSPLQQYL